MDPRPYCFQTGHPLGFAVQLRLTPELKQALLNARSNGDAVSLRFREEPHREAVLSIAGQEHFFSTAPQAGQLEVVEVAPKSKGAVSVAAVKQRLTLQRTVDSADTRPRGLAGSLAGGMPDDRRKRAAVLLDGSQRGTGMHPRVTTEVVTRTAQQPPPQPSAVTAGSAGRLAGSGMAPRPTHGTAPSGPRGGVNATDGTGLGGGPPRKPMELPKPRSQQPGGGAAKPAGVKARKTPTPPPPEMVGSATAATVAAGAAGACQNGGGSGGSGGGGGSSPVGHGAAAGGGGSGGGAAAAPVAQPPPPPPAPAAPAPALVSAELPRAAVLAARRGDLPLVVAALLREQPLTGSSLQSRIDATYKAAGAKPEAREYVKRVIDNCCTMSANRMHFKPDVLAREAARLDEMMSGTSPTAGDTPFAAGQSAATGTAGPGRPSSARQGQVHGQGGGSSLKRMASCSPDPRLSPDQDTGLGAGLAGRSTDEAALSVGTADEDEEGSLPNLTQSHHHGSSHNLQAAAAAATARGARHGPAGAKRQKTGVSQPQAQAQGGARPVSGPAGGGRGAAGGGGGSGLQGYDDFDDLADPPVASAPAREGSGGRPPGQGLAAGQAAAAKASAARKAPVISSGGPKGLPSFASLQSAPVNAAPPPTQPPQPPQQQQQQQQAPPAPAAGKARLAVTVGALGAAASRAGSLSPVANHANGVPAAPTALAPASAPAASQGTWIGSEDSAGKARDGEGTNRAGRGGGGSGGGPGGADSRADTDADTQGNNPARPTASGAASPSCTESGLDPELQAYADLELQEEDRDADWYRSYVDWKPEPHATVQTHEQYEQYEREYRAKFEVYHRLNQKYNEVVREADALRAAVDAARCAEERHRCVLALWRLGASKWRLLEVWKQARRNLHADLGDLRDKVAEYVARQEARGQR